MIKQEQTITYNVTPLSTSFFSILSPLPTHPFQNTEQNLLGLSKTAPNWSPPQFVNYFLFKL